MQETRVGSLGREDPLEKEMATHSSLLAWRIPWTEEPGGLQSGGVTELDTTQWLNNKIRFTKKTFFFKQNKFYMQAIMSGEQPTTLLLISVILSFSLPP